ncbi:MAG: KamA family radical SAM protein, partial [Calditrichales bacterium]
MYKPKYITDLKNITQIPSSEQNNLEQVTDKFMFRTNAYYQSLINWDDPDDPIKRIVIPEMDELLAWGRLDASDEEEYTRVPGMEHKYQYTALLLVNDVCGAYCRFCFRKRLFMNDNDEVVRDISEGLAYIREHTEINNVLLTGGYPMIMSTRKLEDIIRQLREIDHVKIIRIGTKMPAFNPYRIIDNPDLLKMVEKYSVADKKIYIMAHFNHPRELTDVAVKSLLLLQKAGAITVNQTPLLRGVNDDPEVLAELFNKLSY